MIIEIKRKVPIYGNQWIIVFYDDEDEFEKKYGYNNKGFNAVAFQKTLKSGAVKMGTAFLIKDITPGIIAHEAKHLLNYIYIDNGVYLDRENDEPECYLLMWIVNRIHEAALKNNLKIK